MASKTTNRFSPEVRTRAVERTGIRTIAVDPLLAQSGKSPPIAGAEVPSERRRLCSMSAG